MTIEQALLRAEAVLKESELRGFTNTAAAMREVINSFQEVGAWRGLKNDNQMEAAVVETVH